MSASRVTAAVVVIAAVMAAVWPVSPAIDPGDAVRARLVAAGLSAALAVAVAMARGVRRTGWIVVAGALLTVGAIVVVQHASATGACVASYDGRPVVIGQDLTTAGAQYVAAQPGLGASDLLLDAGGAADRIWTPASIASCRVWVGWAGLLSLPLFAGGVSAAFAAKGLTLGTSSRTAAAVAPAPGAVVYDAFLSYRHTEPDRSYADEIVRVLEAHGHTVAIDYRDFAPNQHFLSEMERCIKESRFTLCVLTARYLESDHTGEEAVIAKTLDLAERTKRIVPLVYERVPLPVWLHGLVGIDFTADARLDPQARLLELLGKTRDAG